MFNQFQAAAPLILPSLLQCDFGNLEREVHELESAGIQGLHLDVMDGHFVPNLTYGMPLVRAIRGLTDIPLDVHLMIDNPGQYVESFREAGADMITIHAEAVDDPGPVLDRIRQSGAGAGLAINPTTPVSTIEPYWDACDLVLVMSVMPGFGGQSFDTGALEKLREVRRRTAPSVLVEVDGGVDLQTIGPCARAGAQLLVVGSAIFRCEDYASAIASLTDVIGTV